MERGQIAYIQNHTLHVLSAIERKMTSECVSGCDRIDRDGTYFESFPNDDYDDDDEPKPIKTHCNPPQKGYSIPAAQSGTAQYLKLLHTESSAKRGQRANKLVREQFLCLFTY